MRLAATPRLVPALLLVVACASPTQPEPIRVRPAAAAYVRGAGGEAAVGYSVSNAGSSEVLLTSTCGARLAPTVERREGGGWVQYAGGVCLAVEDMSPKPLAAGATRDETVSVREAGTYRLALGTDRGLVRSGEFSVR